MVQSKFLKLVFASGLLLLMHTYLMAGGLSQWPQTIVKTNVLNVLLIPSGHLEQQVYKRLSLQGNFHRARVNFIGLSHYLNASVDARYYILTPKLKNNPHALQGLYPALGMQVHHDYQGVSTVGGISTYDGTTEYGPQVKLGYQYQSPQSRFVVDLHIGLAAMVGQLQKTDTYYPDSEGRIGLSIGYRLQ
jgi:hypothetical protein